MTKIAEVEVNYCNSSCPYFYHSYEDYENVWCAHEKLNAKVYDEDGCPLIWGDCKKREIPKECPLEDKEQWEKRTNKMRNLSMSELDTVVYLPDES